MILQLFFLHQIGWYRTNTFVSYLLLSLEEMFSTRDKTESLWRAFSFELVTHGSDVSRKAPNWLHDEVQDE